MSRFYRGTNRATTNLPHWLAVLLLGLAFALLVSSAVQKSATVDEQSHLFRGVAYLQKGATHFLLGHPLGASALSALPLLTEPDLRLPLDTPAWEAGDWSVAGDLFLWQLNANPQRLLFLGRLPVMWLTLLLGALLFRWGRQLAAPLAGLAAMALVLFDPNVLAHGRFITGDLALTLFFTLTVYGYWRWAQKTQTGGWHWSLLLLTGLGLGLAAVAKFNAALLLPILGLLGLGLCWQRRQWRPLLALLVVGAVGGVVIWLVYGLALRPFPGGAFWDDLFWFLRYTGGGHGQYLFGQASPTGWWYYFPVTYLLKEPLVTLGLLLAGALVALRKRPWRSPWRSPWRATSAWFLLLPALLYLLVSMSSALNIGVRYLIPMMPFLALATAVSLWRLAGGRWARQVVVVGALAVVVVSLWQWPNYIPFFNILAGGRDNNWRLLSDSNVDWGQDLPALAAWQQAHNQPLFLSYFGMAHPSAYGVRATMLPTWPPGPEQTPPWQQAYYPPQPAPGTYAISVTNLHGVVLGEQRDAFDWFRQRRPDWRLGGSIFMYEVPSTGVPVEVAFSGLVPAEMDEGLYGRFQSNDLRVRWFDARTSLVWPADGGWLVAADAQQPGAELASFWPGTAVATAPAAPIPHSLFATSAVPADLLNMPAVDFGGVLALRGWRRLDAPDGTLALLTIWEVRAETERPFKLFVHALNENGEIVGQWDGLDVPSTYWKVGDIFVQSHRFAVSKTGAVTQLTTGVYDAETLSRLAEPFTLEE